MEMGSGHLMRCLTLAVALREKGAEVLFISRELPGNLISYVKSKDFSVHCLPAPRLDREFQPESQHAGWLSVPWQVDAEEVTQILKKKDRQDWVIVDHYALDKRWETQVRPFTKRIMVIDDIADRPHDSDILLDQNLYQDMDTRYDGLVPMYCKKLLGPEFVLLRAEFIEARKNLRIRDGSVKRILIFFGGSDPTNETGKALDAVATLNRQDIAIDVVVGNANPHKDRIQHICTKMPSTTFYCQVENMAELMANANLGIGAGGSTMWERCYLGLPSITVVIAENQLEITKTVAARGAICNLGLSTKVNVGLILKAVNKDENYTILTEILETTLGTA